MTSNVIRGIRKKKSNNSEIKILIAGKRDVGKSALTVRFLTRKFIGEYCQGDNRYRNDINIDGDIVCFEIWESCSKSSDCDMSALEIIQWADAFLFVYSITNRASFDYVKKLKRHIDENEIPNAKTCHSSVYPLFLVGTKNDLIHLREITTEEGQILSKDFDCQFFEVSSAEQIEEIIEVFHKLYREFQYNKKRNKQSLFDRMLGNVSNKAVSKLYTRGKSDGVLSRD